MPIEKPPQPEIVKKKELEPTDSLEKILDFSDELTKERNEKYFPTRDKRVVHLFLGGVEMLDTIRAREKHGKFIPIVASKILLRALNVMQSLSNRDAIIDKLIEKYPKSGCSYCGKKPCECAVIRPEDIVGANSSAEQKKWTISDWQNHLNDVYGADNKKRELDFVSGRLVSEIGELSEAAILMEKYEKSDTNKSEKFRDEATSEAADVIAWIFAVCNEVDTDLQKAFVERYGKGCPNCHKFPCRCGEFSHKQERKIIQDM